MYSSRLATLAAICAVAAAIGAAGASGSGIKGEPVFQGSLGPQSTSLQAKQLDPAQIALVRVGARTAEPERRPTGSRTPRSRLGAAGDPRAPHRQQHQLVRLDDRGDRRTRDRRYRRNRSMERSYVGPSDRPKRTWTQRRTPNASPPDQPVLNQIIEPASTPAERDRRVDPRRPRPIAGESAAPYVAGPLIAIRGVPRRVGLTRDLDQLSQQAEHAAD